MEKYKLFRSVLDELRKEYINRYNLKNYIHLNAGYCKEYAYEAVNKLNEYGIEAEVVESHNIWTEKLNTELRLSSNNIQSIGVWNNSLLNKYNGTTHIDDFFKGLLAPPYHVWIYFNGKHYDAETMRGVSNFFDFPYYRYFINKSPAERVVSQRKLNSETLEKLLGSSAVQVKKIF